MKKKIILALIGFATLTIFGILATTSYPQGDGVFEHPGIVYAFLSGIGFVLFAVSVYLFNKKN